jgi:ParB family chromosome partitioning protein
MGKLDQMRSLKGNVAGANVKPRTLAAPPAPDPKTVGVSRSRDTASIAVDRIQPDPDQPRKEFDHGELVMLGASLLQHGQLQPIRVRWCEERQSYVIIAGERRWRAAVLAQVPALQAVIVENRDPEAVLLEQLVENALRSDLKPLEQAEAYKRIIDARGITHAELAKLLAITQPSVTKALALLDLPLEVKDKVNEGTLAPATAYEISKAPPEARPRLAQAATTQNLTRDQVVSLRTARSTRTIHCGDFVIRITGPVDGDLDAALA